MILYCTIFATFLSLYCFLSFGRSVASVALQWWSLHMCGAMRIPSFASLVLLISPRMYNPTTAVLQKPRSVQKMQSSKRREDSGFLTFSLVGFQRSIVSSRSFILDPKSQKERQKIQTSSCIQECCWSMPINYSTCKTTKHRSKKLTNYD